MKKLARLICFLTFIQCSANLVLSQAANPANDGLPLTVAEKSDYQSTSLSAEVIEFVETCAAGGQHVTKFSWGRTVEDREMVGAIVSKKQYELGDQDDRNVVLLLGNIHSGECAGKEALLMMLRELTKNPDHPWLEHNVIIFAPNYNADANDHVGKNNRPGQVGPESGMGRRENVQQLDLNRDFCKIESPEARALVALINKTNPHIFVDCHTTNGSQHRYGLTYSIPNNPATAEPIRKFLRNKMMPVVTERLEKKGQSTFYYGNFNAEHTTWTTVGPEPRYSTEYVGLRGRLAFLSEAYSYLDYKGRIVATKDFVSALLDYATEHHQDIHELLAQVDRDLIETAKTQPERIEVSLQSQIIPFEKKFPVKGFKDGKPHDYQCDFVGDFKTTNSSPLPFAYVVPRSLPRIVDRLLMHGAKVEKLDRDLVVVAEVDTVAELTRSRRGFQKHLTVRAGGNRNRAELTIPAGSYLVPTAQPLGRFIGYMLELESDDGFVFWNFFDNAIAVGKRYPVMRVAKPVEMQTSSVTQVDRVEKITLDAIDGTNGLASGIGRRPRWIGTSNWLQTSVFDRARLMDARTGALVNRPARPYRVNNVRSALVAAGVDAEIAGAMAASEPILPTHGQVAIFSGRGHAAVYFTEGQKNTADAIELLGNPKSQAELFRFDDAETQFAFTNEKGLHFFDLETRETKSVLSPDAKHLTGKLDWVYQEELYGRGNFKGFWWQSGGNRVAFLQLNETPLIPFTVMDHIPILGKSEFTNYPKAGDPIPTVKVGVVDSKKPSDLTWVDLSKYADDEILITGVTWSADGSKLLIQVQNRVQTWLDVVATDATGKNARVLFRDQTPAWIESPGDPIFLNNGEFLWRSPRSGFNHIYQYDANGKLIGEITSGQWEVRSLLGVSPDKKYAYFTSAKENPTEMQGYRVDLETQEITRLTTEPGTHSLSFNHDFSMFVDSFSDTETPSRYVLRENDGTKIRRLYASSDDRLKYLDIAKPEFFTIPSGGDQPMDAMLIKPTNFDPKKTYPVMTHIYAGPQAPRVRNQFGGKWYLWHQMLAQQGYIVFIVDNRSASYRSSKNVWPIHRNFAAGELQDIETAIKWLKEQSWVDGERVGLWGWSYGGYMTAYALTHSKSFKIGISGAPVTDWKNYDAVYTERYMGLPQENVEGYRTTSVLNGAAKHLHGKLLLIHGTIDDNVHLNNSLQFAKELQYAGKQFEMMMYPSNRHSVTDPKQAAHLRRLMTEFIVDNL